MPAQKGNVGDEPETAEIDADQGHAMGREFPGNAQHGAVTAHDDGQIGVRCNLGQGLRFKVGAPQIVRKSLLEHRAQSTKAQEVADRNQRLSHGFRMLTAKQGDGLERCSHAGISPHFARSSCDLRIRPSVH